MSGVLVIRTFTFTHSVTAGYTNSRGDDRYCCYQQLGYPIAPRLGCVMQAQRLDGLPGKIVRLNPDGSSPTDNPFAGAAGARPEIWSLGHRNIQGAALR